MTLQGIRTRTKAQPHQLWYSHFVAFDPFSWAAGFTLSRSANWLLDREKSIDELLNDAVTAWSQTLPGEAWLDPHSLFGRIASDNDLAGHPKLAELRERLRSREIPRAPLWKDALIEQWRYRKRQLGDQGQPFFHLPEDAASAHLQDLAARLERACESDTPLFRGTMLRLVGQLSERTAQPFVLPSPLHPSDVTNFALVADAIENETGARVHLLLHDSEGRRFYVWLAGVDPVAPSTRWVLLSCACLTCAQSDTDEIVIGVSFMSDLPHSDGRGAVGPLRVHFPLVAVREIVKKRHVPVGYWNDLNASILEGDNSPFQHWQPLPFRQLEEMR